jgi:sulfur relay (sulfurtransferase) DsrC/TusE family protein
MSVLDNFQDWKEFLANRVIQAEKSGMSEETMKNIAYQIGDYLSDKVDPKNDQERLLKELWDAGNEEEQKVMAGMMIKYVKNQVH